MLEHAAAQVFLELAHPRSGAERLAPRPAPASAASARAPPGRARWPPARDARTRPCAPCTSAPPRRSWASLARHRRHARASTARLTPELPSCDLTGLRRSIGEGAANRRSSSPIELGGRGERPSPALAVTRPSEGARGLSRDRILRGATNDPVTKAARNAGLSTIIAAAFPFLLGVANVALGEPMTARAALLLGGAAVVALVLAVLKIGMLQKRIGACVGPCSAGCSSRWPGSCSSRHRTRHAGDPSSCCSYPGRSSARPRRRSTRSPARGPERSRRGGRLERRERLASRGAPAVELEGALVGASRSLPIGRGARDQQRAARRCGSASSRGGSSGGGGSRAR